MEAFVLGCGGMMPLPGRHLTSVLLRREGGLFLFDCGEGTQVSLRRLNLKWKKISAIFISHTHADHVTGLPGILMLSSQVDRDEPLYIYGPPRIAEYVETNRRVLDMFINYEIVVREITAGGPVFGEDEFFVRAFPLNHTKPCFGYVLEEYPRPGAFFPEKAQALGVKMGPLWGRLQNGERVQAEDGRTVLPEEVLGLPRSGRKFTFVTDTLPCKTIAPEAYGSDFFVCEGMFENELADSAHEKKHMTAVEAARIAAEAEVKKLGLIHYSPRYNDHDLRILRQEAREIFPNTVLCRDGEVHPIEFTD
jgi:ribonuclease Z